MPFRVEIRPAARDVTASGTWRPLIATATPASPLARSEMPLGGILNRDSPVRSSTSLHRLSFRTALAVRNLLLLLTNARSQQRETGFPLQQQRNRRSLAGNERDSLVAPADPAPALNKISGEARLVAEPRDNIASRMSRERSAQAVCRAATRATKPPRTAMVRS